MDEELSQAVERHKQVFGRFNATTIGVNMSAPGVKERVLSAIAKAIETGTPISDADIGATAPEGARI